jgi:hypothetical protein
MPLYNWLKCTDGNMKYIRLNIKKGNALSDQFYWESMYDKYIEHYGLGKLYSRMLEQMRRVAMLELEYVITNDRFQLTKLEMENQRLQSMMNSGGTGVSLEQGLVYLSKWLGYAIVTKNISVKSYFDMLKEYERYNKISNGKKN